MRPSFRFVLLLFFTAGLLLPACQTEPQPAPEITKPIAGPSALTTPEDPTLQDFEAMRRRAGTDLNELLVLMNRHELQFGGNADFWYLYGETTLAMAAQEIGKGRTQGLDFLYTDAADAFRSAIKLEANRASTWWLLAYAYRQAGDFDRGWDAAAAALPLLTSEDPQAGAIREEVGRVGLALTIEAIQAGYTAPPAADLAENALREGHGTRTLASFVVLSDLLAWQGRKADALEPLVDALLQSPSFEEAQGRLKNLATPTQLSRAWDRVRVAHPGNAFVLWTLGAAQWGQLWEARALQDFLTAYESLDRAEECFLTAMTRNPEYAQSCKDWLHLVRTARGWTLWEDLRIEDAAQAFLTAIEADPSRVELEPTKNSLNLGISSVVGNAFRENRLEEARAILARIFAVHQSNPDWTNNYGFVCRDLGVQALEAGETLRAGELFQQSWAAYSKTVELAPQDVRLVNDRALIAVYYLNDHHDLAEAELHRAIQIGDAQQAAMNKTHSPQQRQDLDEAIGDAWENLAYLDVFRRQRTDRAENFLKKARQHYPFENRSGVLRIQEALRR